MGFFDSVLNQVSQHSDVANLAGKLGIDPAMAEKAIAALGVAHQQPGDTVELAAGKTGLDTGTLGQIVQAIGGEGSLTQFAATLKEHPQAASIFAMFDKDGDGQVMDDLADMAKGLFGKS